MYAMVRLVVAALAAVVIGAAAALAVTYGLPGDHSDTPPPAASPRPGLLDYQASKPRPRIAEPPPEPRTGPPATEAQPQYPQPQYPQSQPQAPQGEGIPPAPDGGPNCDLGAPCDSHYGPPQGGDSHVGPDPNEAPYQPPGSAGDRWARDQYCEAKGLPPGC